MSFIRLLVRATTSVAQAAAPARFVTMGTGIQINWIAAIGNLTRFVATTSVGLCTLLFIVGAGQLTMSRGDQTKVDNGKKLMISSLIGVSLVMGSYAIVRTVMYFLYEWAP